MSICNVTQLLCAYCNPVCGSRKSRKDDYMEQEKKYVCGFCGKKYETVVGRMNCESACAMVEKEKAEKEQREKLSREKEERQQKIIQSRKELLELEQNYYKDYGEYVYVLREPVKSTADFNEDWNRYFRDAFKKFYW